jgi:D-3-phosphoglycerate dehydrogenase / 2-oxoglutarate reductase
MDTVQTLIVELLEWIGPGDRPYDEVQEAWRTSCPRLPVWEDAMAAGYLETRFEPWRGRFVAVSPTGRALLVTRDRS